MVCGRELLLFIWMRGTDVYKRQDLLNLSNEKARCEKERWFINGGIYMEYVMIGTGMAVAITCILILEMIEYRRIQNETRKVI